MSNDALLVAFKNMLEKAIRIHKQDACTWLGIPSSELYMHMARWHHLDFQIDGDFITTTGLDALARELDKEFASWETGEKGAPGPQDEKSAGKTTGGTLALARDDGLPAPVPPAGQPVMLPPVQEVHGTGAAATNMQPGTMTAPRVPAVINVHSPPSLPPEHAGLARRIQTMLDCSAARVPPPHGFLKFVQHLVRVFKPGAANQAMMFSRAVHDTVHACLVSLAGYPRYLTSSSRQAAISAIDAVLVPLTNACRAWRNVVAHARDAARACKEVIEHYNECYVAHHLDTHASFFTGKAVESGSGPGAALDGDQAQAVLVDDDMTIAIAGPGSGKTKTLVARVAFMVHVLGIPKERIMVLAFNKNAVAEVNSRLSRVHGISGVRVSTFHALGFSVLNSCNGPVQIEDHGRRAVRAAIEQMLRSDTEFRLAYMAYFTRYMDRVQVSSMEFARVARDWLAFQRTKEYEALDGTTVKSIAERDIATFFFSNSIRYEYESLASWCDVDAPDRVYRPDFYLPDHDIYLEHWAVGRSSTVPDFFGKTARAYLEEQAWKRGQFAKHGKVLWETDVDDWLSGKLEVRLEHLCRSAGVPLVPLDGDAIASRLGRFPEKKHALDDAIASVIEAAKVAGHDPGSLARRLHDKRHMFTRKDDAFFKLVLPAFAAYEHALRSAGKIDFQDMINLACSCLAAMPAGHAPPALACDVIMVDEFQDISRQRLALIEGIRRLNPGSRMFYVGDDWQAIYGFAGSTNKYITGPGEHLGAGTIVFLSRNYRNHAGIIDLGKKVMSRCHHRHVTKEIIGMQLGDRFPVHVHRIVASSEHEHARLQASRAIEVMRGLVDAGADPANILVLCRFTFGLASVKEACSREKGLETHVTRPDGSIRRGLRFMTIHKAKGLEADHVLLLAVHGGLFGFPPDFTSGIDTSLIDDDMTGDDDEERRLFFVAVTRARKTLHLFTRAGNESPFLDGVSESIGDIVSKDKAVMARVIETRERAVRLEVINTWHEPLAFWVPRAAITGDFRDDEPGEQPFAIATWYRDKLQREQGENNITHRGM